LEQVRERDVVPEGNGIRGLVKKTDWPRYTEEEPEIMNKKNSMLCSKPVTTRSDSGLSFFDDGNERTGSHVHVLV